MMSVSLDEALEQRARGELARAQQQVAITSDLLLRLARILTDSCTVVSERAKHLGSLPLVQPLNTNFFRGDTGQSAASWNTVLHNVLLGERSRFFHKLRILSTTLENLGTEFEQVAGGIAGGLCTEPAACWSQLDALHYDVNTCLREAEIIFKSFLHALPADQLAALDVELNPSPATPKPRLLLRLTRVSA